MNTEEIVADEPLKEAEEHPNCEQLATDAFAPLEPPGNRFGALLKAIEIWVQTR